MSIPVEALDREHRRFRLWWLAIPVILIVIAGIILELIPDNVYVLLPGDALPVAPMISIPDHHTKHKTGELLLTDVSLFKANHLLEELWGRLQTGSDVEPASAVAGGLPESQFEQLNLALMDDSIHQAEFAALSNVPGYHPRLAPTGPKIVYVLPNLPASKALKVGDVILDVDGHRVHRATDVSPLVKRVRPGSIVSLNILRGLHSRVVRVKTVAAKNGQPNKNGKMALIGIEAINQFLFPIKISVNPGSIGGPSAGLMFTLGIIQRLVPNDITHGCRIAGTGTIDETGKVGPIGGVQQKILAARNANAQYFLVPTEKDNLQPALANRGSIHVIPVTTLHQALDALKGIPGCR